MCRVVIFIYICADLKVARVFIDWLLFEGNGLEMLCQLLTQDPGCHWEGSFSARLCLEATLLTLALFQDPPSSLASA